MLRNVLDHLERDNGVEGLIFERKVANVANLEVNPGGLTSARCLDHALRDVDANHLLGSGLGKDPRSVSDSAARIEYPSAFDQRSDPPVTPAMLGLDELASHDVGNEPLGHAVDEACEVDLHPGE